MTYVFVEWYCKQCKTLHRKRFQVKPYKLFYQHTYDKSCGGWTPTEKRQNAKICIHDYAFRGKYGRSTVYCDTDVTNQQIREAIIKYIQTFCNANRDSIKVKFCA